MEPRGPAIYNPFGRGDATEIADKALAGESWSEPHYLRQAQRYLGWATRVLREAGDVVRLDSLVSLMDPDRQGRGVAMRSGDSAAVGSIPELARDATASGPRRGAGRLAILAESQFGGYLDPTSGGAVIDLGATWRTGAVVYFRLDADRYPLASQMLGAAIVATSSRADRRAPTDRAAGPGRDRRVRGGWRESDPADAVAIAFRGHQRRRRDPGLADLEDVAGTDGGNFAARVLSQVDFTVAHRQPDPRRPPSGCRSCAERASCVGERTRAITPSRSVQPREGMRTAFMSSFGTQASSSASALAKRS